MKNMLVIMYDAIYFVHINCKLNFKIKFQEILKYKFVIMCMLNTYNLLFVCRFEFQFTKYQVMIHN